MAAHTPPKEWRGTAVWVCGDPLTVNGEDWVTLVPEDTDDERLWEFSLTTGRTIQTAS